MGADFSLHHVPKKIQIKYVKEVRPDGTITSSYELTDLTSYHQVSSDGDVNAQAMIIWKKFKN